MKNFVFIHVMKCAGTTTMNLLRAAGEFYGDKGFRKEFRDFHIQFTDRSETYYNRKFKPTVEEQFTIDKVEHLGGPVVVTIRIPGPHKAVGGHFTVNKFKYLGWPFVTIIRDPVERIISYYSVWKDTPKEMEYDWTLRNFVDGCTNQMVEMLGTDLRKLLFVGIQEEYDESLRRMGKILEIKWPPRGKRVKNKTRVRLEVSDEDREYIRKVNHLDQDLYERAVYRFNTDERFI